MTKNLDWLLLIHVLCTSFPMFLRKAFQTVSPEDQYQHGWHIEAIAYELMRCHSGANTRLIINQPPRSMKSIATAVAFVAWAIGKNPSLRFICVSYSQDLANALSRYFGTVVTSDWYRRIFPSVQFTKKSETELETSAGGGRLATSIGGTLTGRGGDIIIIDDPLKAEEAQSEDARRNVINWYKRTLLSRLNDKRRGVIILVMQRLHEEDLSGYLLEQGGWHHLDLPAIAIETQDIRIGPNATDVHCRKEGDVLHPGREPFDALMAIKNAIGSQLFSAQYQQRPVPAEGNLIKREWLKFYDSMPEGWPEVQIIQSWDIAGTVKETGNYSVCTTWAVHKKTYYLIDVWRGRLEYPDLRRKVISMQEEFGAKTVLIEMAGLGLNLVHDLLNDSPIGFPNPIGIEPKGDKRDRMAAASAQIEAGHMLLPKEAPWLGDFMHELLAFPGGRYDDQVDSVSQFINWNGKRSKPRVSLFGPKVFYAK